MYYLVLILAAVALVAGRPSTVDRHNKLLDIDNHIDPNVVPTGKGKPFVTLINGPPATLAHHAGTTLEITCEAVAEPAPSVHWFKNDAPVYEYDKESNEIIDTNPSSLARVTSTLLVSRSEDPAEYTCLVLAGSNTARASTLVYSADGSTDTSERSKLVPLAPRILVSYKVLVDVMGNNVVLPCRVRGHPRPIVTWKTSNGQDASDDPRMKVLRSGELLISDLRWSDMGEYYCQASNLFGSTETRTFVYPAKQRKAFTDKKVKSLE
ncbi:neural/ectodermal development factor IMP-L2 [Bicyclus anynana]|uniref:Neural/ectodermal development factor IMP-L2-like n=1 Tax=Bicyclus anynana TaxID=110368 RepID=A0A6J1N8V3_BICAN|nr:neural/ectodermal development factor IMP-L2 [Bicyclus anynana]XP_023941517.1 neural/ectodermal development factor IMP-L2 [Bicyclus anynana]